jgi:hypothetical protein
MPAWVSFASTSFATCERDYRKLLQNKMAMKPVNQIVEELPDEVWYFGYGSNMNPKVGINLSD